MPRVSVEYRTVSKESYCEFCRNHPNISISFNNFKKILYTSNSIYAKYVLEGEKIKLPQGFGSIAISKRKQRFKVTINGVDKIILPINWQETKKLGKKIYHMNSHTEGYRYKWFWFKSEAYLSDAYVWQFNATRVNSRKLAQNLKQENSPYIQLYREYLPLPEKR
jgi:nucleoid DNA-binding protein